MGKVVYPNRWWKPGAVACGLETERRNSEALAERARLGRERRRAEQAKRQRDEWNGSGPHAA